MSKKDELIHAIRKLVVDREQSWSALRSAGASCSELLDDLDDLSDDQLESIKESLENAAKPKA